MNPMKMQIYYKKYKKDNKKVNKKRNFKFGIIWRKLDRNLKQKLYILYKSDLRLRIDLSFKRNSKNYLYN